MMTFVQFCEMKANEGLGLNGKNAALGMSKMVMPTPSRGARLPAPLKVKPMPATAARNPVGNASGLGPAGVEGLKRLGIDLLPPRQDELENLVEKDKRRPPRQLDRVARIA